MILALTALVNAILSYFGIDLYILSLLIIMLEKVNSQKELKKLDLKNYHGVEKS